MSTFTAEHRAKLSASHKANTANIERMREFGRKYGKLNKGRKHSPEHRKKMVQVLRDYKFTEADKAKLSAVWTAEHKERMSPLLKEGHAKMSDSARRKRSIRMSYAKLSGDVPFTLEEALEMSKFRYAIRSLDFRKHCYYSSGLNKYIFEKFYPKETRMCSNPDCFETKKLHAHHITGNSEHHGKGRELWVIPLCARHHREASKQTDRQLAMMYYLTVVKKRRISKSSSTRIDIPATRNLTFRQAVDSVMHIKNRKKWIEENGGNAT